MYYIVLALLVIFAPHVSAAQTTGSLQGFITGSGHFLDQVIIPVILGIAFLALIWNVLRFFVIGSTSEEGQQNAKNLALYSVLAFVLILSFWGIVNILTNGIGLPSSDASCADRQSDYLDQSHLAPCPTSGSIGAAGGPIPSSSTGAGSTGAAGGPIPSSSTGSTGSGNGSVPPGTTSFDVNGNPITVTTIPNPDVNTNIGSTPPKPTGTALTYALPKETPMGAVVSGTVVAMNTVTGTVGTPTYQIVIKDKNGNYVLMHNVELGYPPPSVGATVTAGNTIGYAANPIANLGTSNVIVAAYLGAGKAWADINKTDPSVVLNTATYLGVPAPSTITTTPVFGPQ